MGRQAASGKLEPRRPTNIGATHNANWDFASGGNCGKLAWSESPGERRHRMNVQAHLSELEKRHQAIERELDDAKTHPSVDDLTITELKRKKLQLKDEIERLRHASESEALH